MIPNHLIIDDPVKSDWQQSGDPVTDLQALAARLETEARRTLEPQTVPADLVQTLQQAMEQQLVQRAERKERAAERLEMKADLDPRRQLPLTGGRVLFVARTNRKMRRAAARAR